MVDIILKVPVKIIDDILLHVLDCNWHLFSMQCTVFQTGMVGYPESLTDPSYR